MSTMGTVYLVGAGCGKADLITCRGLALLRGSEVVVYDDLIDPALLEAAPEAEHIYMGKRSGRCSASEAEICAMLIEKAKQGKTVVRLKGGDPFVFGRGGEEMLALQAENIPCEEVPGISSAIAIPAAAGIPVTHRGLSRSFHVITAHSADAEELPAGLEIYAKLEGTLLFLMGLARLEKLARRLVECGMAQDTPAAVVSGGNAPHPAVVRGTLADIAEKTARAGVLPPAVIVVGKTAALELSAPAKLPLSGVTVGLTGTAEITQKQERALTAQGAAVFLAEVSRMQPCPFSFDLTRLERAPAPCLVFTSSNGVKVFFRRLREAAFDLRRLAGCRFAVIGGATGETLARFGITADLCPAIYTGDALAEELLEKLDGQTPIFLFRSRQGSQKLFERLSAGRQVEDIALYEVRCDRERSLRAAARLPEMDYLTFSSAGGVKNYFSVHGEVPANTVCVCIGDITAQALRKYSDKPFLTAPEISAEGLLCAIMKAEREKAAL